MLLGVLWWSPPRQTRKPVLLNTPGHIEYSRYTCTVQVMLLGVLWWWPPKQTRKPVLLNTPGHTCICGIPCGGRTDALTKSFCPRWHHQLADSSGGSVGKLPKEGRCRNGESFGIGIFNVSKQFHIQVSCARMSSSLACARTPKTVPDKCCP